MALPRREYSDQEYQREGCFWCGQWTRQLDRQEWDENQWYRVFVCNMCGEEWYEETTHYNPRYS